MTKNFKFSGYDWHKEDVITKRLDKLQIGALYNAVHQNMKTLSAINSFLSDIECKRQFEKNDEDVKRIGNVFDNEYERTRLVSLQKEMTYFAICTPFLLEVREAIRALKKWEHTVVEPYERNEHHKHIYDLYVLHNLPNPYKETFSNSQYQKQNEEEAIAV